MELTRQQKIEVLECAIIILEKGESYFMCVAIDKAYSIVSKRKHEGRETSLAINRIPELLEYKPAGIDRNLSWFPIGEEGMRKRIEILNEILKKLEDDERIKQEEKDKGIEVGDKIS